MLSLQFCGIWFLANVFTNASLQYTTVTSSTILSSTSGTHSARGCEARGSASEPLPTGAMRGLLKANLRAAARALHAGTGDLDGRGGLQHQQAAGGDAEVRVGEPCQIAGSHLDGAYQSESVHAAESGVGWAQRYRRGTRVGFRQSAWRNRRRRRQSHGRLAGAQWRVHVRRLHHASQEEDWARGPD